MDKACEPKHNRSMLRIVLRTGIVISAGAWPVSAFACTLCHTEQAAAVRARVLQSDLIFNAGAVVLPLALLACMIALIARGPVVGGRTQ
jgi:hypothetical protein